MSGNPASRKIGLKCFLTRYSSLIGSPRVVEKIRSENSESLFLSAVAPLFSCFNFTKSRSTQLCSLTTRRLQIRFVSSKVHRPSFLCRLRFVQTPDDTNRSTLPIDILPTESQVFAGAHSGSQCQCEDAHLRSLRCNPQKRPSLFCRQYAHFSTLLTRKLNSLRWVI